MVDDYVYRTVHFTKCFKFNAREEIVLKSNKEKPLTWNLGQDILIKLFLQQRRTLTTIHSYRSICAQPSTFIRLSALGK